MELETLGNGKLPETRDETVSISIVIVRNDQTQKWTIEMLSESK
jgi:hypothetical protein